MRNPVFIHQNRYNSLFKNRQQYTDKSIAFLQGLLDKANDPTNANTVLTEAEKSMLEDINVFLRSVKDVNPQLIARLNAVKAAYPDNLAAPSCVIL